MAGEIAMGVGMRRTVEEAGVLDDEAVALALAAQALLNGVLWGRPAVTLVEDESIPLIGRTPEDEGR